MVTEHKKKSIISWMIPISFFILAIILIIATFYTSSYSVRENSLTIYRGRGLLVFSYFFTDGYKVDFADIADIELLPYSPRELSETIDNYAYRMAGDAMIGYIEGFYLNASEGGRNSPTIWITRYSGTPMVLQFPHGRTERLYEEFSVAWRTYWEALLTN